MSAVTTTTHLRAVPEPGETQRLVASSVEALADILGITHARLAELAEVEPTALSKSLKGKRKLPLEEMARLAAALDVPVVLLYDGGEEIRRRAKAAIYTEAPENGPGAPVGRDNGLPDGMATNVVPLRARRTGPASEPQAA